MRLLPPDLQVDPAPPAAATAAAAAISTAAARAPQHLQLQQPALQIEAHQNHLEHQALMQQVFVAGQQQEQAPYLRQQQQQLQYAQQQQWEVYAGQQQVTTGLMLPPPSTTQPMGLSALLTTPCG